MMCGCAAMRLRVALLRDQVLLDRVKGVAKRYPRLTQVKLFNGLDRQEWLIVVVL